MKRMTGWFPGRAYTEEMIIDIGIRNPIFEGKAIDRLAAYEDTGLEPDLIEELKAKQKPKKAVWEKGFFGGYSCPNCKEIFIAKKSPYCSVCGQAIDWEN